MDETLTRDLKRLIAAEGLPPNYLALSETWLEPLAAWLVQRYQSAHAPLSIGVHGGQGTGKTTLCRTMELLLAHGGLEVVTLSLDDFYLTREQRQQLAGRVHPLFATRGVPGTHDVVLLQQTLESLRDGRAVELPVFDKAEDDRLPREQWRKIESRADIILLEGWCVGCRPQADEFLEAPQNALEAEEDRNAAWRRYVNQALGAEYAQLFANLDYLVMLAAPSMEAVLEWRLLQESKLGPGSQRMNQQGVERFVQHYERITRHALSEMPERADYLLEFDTDHQIVRAGSR